ncbi:MAG: hypothetical protein ACRDPE_23730 [Solirubrobacterales bacterium]
MGTRTGDVRWRGRRRALGPAGAVLVLAVLASSLPSPAGAAQNAAEFYARTAAGKTVSCAIYDGYGGDTEAFCEFVSGHTQAKATVQANGSVILCRSHRITSDRCELGNAGENSPTYRAGKTVRVGRFACTVLGAGVRCVVTATGKGFLLGPQRLQGVGGADVRRT